jgi:hypothetical protein
LAKTVAGILGLPAEEVYRHAERKRRQKLIRNAASAIILLLAAGAAYSSDRRSGVPQKTPTDIEALVNKYAPAGSADTDGFRERLRGAFEGIAAGAADPRLPQVRARRYWTSAR